MKLSPTEIYQDRKIFLIGSTGFLGKSDAEHAAASVSKYRQGLRNCTRAFAGRVGGEILEPHHNCAARLIHYANDTARALEGFVRDKVIVRGGDIGETNLGYTEEQAQEIADDIDIVINSAGNVTFNPTLKADCAPTSSALRTSSRLRDA